MSSRFLSVVLLAWTAILPCPARTLRVCADPNNLPFSNQKQQGFENRIATMLANGLGADLQYVWWSERKNFIKNTLEAGKCDAVLGVPSHMDSVPETRPFYRSTYVFVSRAGQEVKSFDDPALHHLRIGVHVVGDDYAPPAILLARHGLMANVVSYRLIGTLGEQNPPARIVEAVANRDIDVAVVWGPFGGYFAKNLQESDRSLRVTPVTPQAVDAVPFTYEMSIATRPGDTALRDELNKLIGSQCAAIQAVLKEYGIPLIEPEDRSNRCASVPAA